MKYYILYDPEKCWACGACSVACMDQNDIDVSKGQLPFRTVCEFEDPGQMEGSCEYLSISCRHCADAPCMAGCPTGCLQKDLATGMTVYDRSKCIGCHSCAMACPFGIPRFDLLDGKLVKCDGCFVRLESGMAPACVRACAFGALICVDEAGFEKLEQEKRVSSLLKAVNHV